MKVLPPTQRDPSRYFAFSLSSQAPVLRRDLVTEILVSASTLLGDMGSSELGLRLLGFEDDKGIIRCAADRVWESRAALASISSVKGIRVAIQILGVSGTVRGATEKYLLTQNKSGAEPERKREPEIKECKIVIEKSTIFGSIVNVKHDEIDLLPEDSEYKDISNRSNTRYLGITVFDLEDKEID